MSEKTDPGSMFHFRLSQQRARNRIQFTEKHDDRKSLVEWVFTLTYQLGKLTRDIDLTLGTHTPTVRWIEAFQNRLVKIATVCMAAWEAMERRK